MTGKEKLAQRIASLKVAAQLGAVVGKVVSVSPLEISISDEIIAKSPNLVKASGLTLSVGDVVIVIASTDNTTFYAIARSEVV